MFDASKEDLSFNRYTCDKGYFPYWDGIFRKGNTGKEIGVTPAGLSISPSFTNLSSNWKAI